MAITLRAARVNKNLTQEEAAAALKIATKTLWNYEKGISFPDIPIIKRIERLYGVSYDDIIFLPRNNG